MENKLVEFKTKAQSTIDDLFANMRKEIADKQIDNVMIICKDRNSQEVIIGNYNLSVCDKIELQNHLQIHIMDKFIQENYLN